LRYNTVQRGLEFWQTEQFDVTGSAAARAAMWPRFAPAIGFESRDYREGQTSGGTCTLRGCIPTKQLLQSAHVYEQMQHAADFGVQATGIQLAFADVQKRKDKVVMKNSKGIEFLMKKTKCTVSRALEN